MSTEELKMSKDKLDVIKGLKINPEDMEKIPDPLDRKFLYISGALAYINGLNSLDRTIQDIIRQVKLLIPIQTDELKIIISRLEDISPSEIDDLSAGFIENLFTIDGKPVNITIPEVGNVDEIQYKRMMIRNVKMIDEQSSVIMEYKKGIMERFTNDIPEDIRKMAGNVIEVDKFFLEYFEYKAKDQNISEEERKDFKKKIEYRNYARSLKPLIMVYDSIYKKSGSRKSILYGFTNNHTRILNSAVEIAHANKFSFPFQTMSGVEEKLFGDKYKDYRNILLYVIANYIHKKKNNINQYDKIFLSDLFTNIMLVTRPDAEKKYPELYQEMKSSIKRLLDIVTGVE